MEKSIREMDAALHLSNAPGGSFKAAEASYNYIFGPRGLIVGVERLEVQLEGGYTYPEPPSLSHPDPRHSGVHPPASGRHRRAGIRRQCGPPRVS